MKLLLGGVVVGRIGHWYHTQGQALRFGAEIVFAICTVKNVEVVILNHGEDTTSEEDLAKDEPEIIIVLTACKYR